MRNYLIFNQKNSKDFGLYISGSATYDSPSVDASASVIPGRNGNHIIENAMFGFRRYQNVNISYNAFFWDGITAKTAGVKSWLLSPIGYRRLQDTYDSDFFRMAVCTDAIVFDITRHTVAEMVLKFNCKPQRWSVSGQDAVRFESSGGNIHNPFDFPSLPLIRVYGSSAGTVTVNGITVTVSSLNGSIDIDCETENASNTSGFCNSAILAEEFPHLGEGDNSISWTGGISAVEIIPRWWCL